jgi:anti-anti-sigma factor
MSFSADSAHPTFRRVFADQAAENHSLQYRNRHWKNFMRVIDETKEIFMEMTEQKAAGVLTLSLSGRLDATTAKAFEEKVIGEIESGERRIVIDLAQLDYVSSAGLRVFFLASVSAQTARSCCAPLTIRSEKCSIWSGSRRCFPFTAPATTEPGICKPKNSH